MGYEIMQETRPDPITNYYFPEDAHMPLISSGQIHKVVVKIAAAPI
jgi:hypothetical protein